MHHQNKLATFPLETYADAPDDLQIFGVNNWSLTVGDVRAAVNDKPKLRPGTIVPTSQEDAAITKAAMSDPDTRPYTDEEWKTVIPSRCRPADKQLMVKVERNRVFIVNGGQSFMLDYKADEGDDPFDIEFYANNLRKALSIITPCVKSEIFTTDKESN